MFATTAVRTAGPRPRFRGTWERNKDAKADRRVRLANVVETYGADAIDVIRIEEGRPFPFVSEVYRVSGVSLIGLARLLHKTGRLHRIDAETWVVLAK